jgi:hypothetical protein
MTGVRRVADEPGRAVIRHPRGGRTAGMLGQRDDHADDGRRRAPDEEDA